MPHAMTERGRAGAQLPVIQSQAHISLVIRAISQAGF